jgi:hypothetical protein
MEHQIIIQSFDDDYFGDEKYVYVSVHLTKGRTFFERFLIAIKYLFGNQCQFGAFDEILLSPKEALRLSEVLKVHATIQTDPVVTKQEDVDHIEQNG